MAFIKYTLFIKLYTKYQHLYKIMLKKSIVKKDNSIIQTSFLI